MERLGPAYGRDYKSLRAVKEDLHAGKDFQIWNFFSPDDMRYANIEDLRRAGHTKVQIRYDKKRKVGIFAL